MNYKVRCTGYKSTERFFTVGKVYDVIDNTIKNDNGYTYVAFPDIIKFLSSWYTFEKIDVNKKIVITTDGKETLARLYEGNKVIKTATAKCSPEDTFDFETGARIAFDRLTESPFSKALRSVASAAAKCGQAIRESTATFAATIKVEKPHEYKAGDRVKIISRESCHRMPIGEVVTLDEVYEPASKKFSTAWFTKEHKTDGGYIRESDFELAKPLKIEVGKKYILKPYDEVKNHMCLGRETWDTISKRYVVVSSYTAHSDCAVCDTCYCGAWAIAVEAFEKEYTEEKYYSGKVVCVEKRKPFAYTVGKVYEFKDGRVKIDNGNTVCTDAVKTLDEWNEKNGYYAKFIPFVE